MEENNATDVEGKDNKYQPGDDSSGAGKHSPEMLSRRAFLNKLSVGLAAATAAVVGAPVVGFLFAPLLRQAPEVWKSVGDVTQFKVGETVEVTFEDPSPLPWAGVTAMTAAWLRRDDEQTFKAYAVNCTHLGCPVNWIQSASLFMCPCHGGVYYKDGAVAAGPPPKPLNTYNVRVRNGQVEIKTKGIPIAGRG